MTLLYLYIRETVTHPESLKIEIHGEEIPSEYRCILYDDYLHALVLSASAHIATLLLTTDVKAIRLVSDLYFLLERLQAWYEQNGSLLSFPPSGFQFSPPSPRPPSSFPKINGKLYTPLCPPRFLIYGERQGLGKPSRTCYLRIVLYYQWPPYPSYSSNE